MPRDIALVPTLHNPGDHAMGLELQIVELVARKAEATRHGWHEELAALDGEIAALQAELAATAAEAAMLAADAELTTDDKGSQLSAQRVA